MAELGQADGWVNLARVYLREGRIPDARAGPREGRRPPEAGRALGHQLADRPDQRAQRLLDEAIASYESVLATRIPDRGFDFSLDYEVINALGVAPLRPGPPGAAQEPGAARFPRKTVATYRRTLAIDSENVAAHYGLGLAYAELARRPTMSSPPPGPTGGHRSTAEIDPSVLTGAATDPKADAELRAAAAARHAGESVAAFLAGPRPEFGSRLEPLHEVVEPLGPASASRDRPAASGPRWPGALRRPTRRCTRCSSPTRPPRAAPSAIARRDNPAADQNAQSIVIHPLHRPGAPDVESGRRRGRPRGRANNAPSIEARIAADPSIARLGAARRSSRRRASPV